MLLASFRSGQHFQPNAVVAEQKKKKKKNYLKYKLERPTVHSVTEKMKNSVTQILHREFNQHMLI